MKTQILLLTAATLAMAACDNKKSETAASETAATTSAATNGVSMAADNAADSVTQSEPVNATQDAVGAVVGQAGAVVTNSPEAFTRAAAISDMYEIESSKIALEKSKNAGVKNFANMMIKGHIATTAELKKIAVGTPPASLDARRQGFIDNLRAADAGSFDKTFLDQQTASHEEALTLHKSFIDDGDNAALKTFAQKTAPQVQMHLDMVKKLDAGAADGSRG